MNFGIIYFYEGVFHLCITTESIARRIEEIFREHHIYTYRIMPGIEKGSFLVREDDFLEFDLPF